LQDQKRQGNETLSLVNPLEGEEKKLEKGRSERQRSARGHQHIRRRSSKGAVKTRFRPPNPEKKETSEEEKLTKSLTHYLLNKRKGRKIEKKISF